MDAPTLSLKQGEAVDKVHAWVREGNASPQVFRFFGYAGTGKTTLARAIVKEYNAICGAFTGKAASVLNRKGILASTIHRMIYKPVMPEKEELDALRKEMQEAQGPQLAELKQEWNRLNQPHFELKDRSDFKGIELIVLDECSMIGEELGNDLLSFGIKILVLGDPAQLPPLAGGGFFTSGEPDILLTEIHRQAAGNPIINMAHLVREGRRLRPGMYGDSLIIDRFDRAVNKNDYRSADQVICGTNRTRARINTAYRDLLGRVGDTIPAVGDKVICLKNNHKIGILNGTQWEVLGVEDNGDNAELRLREWDEEDRSWVLDDDGEETVPATKTLQTHLFNADLKDLTWYERKKYEEFAFGYAITCHKAQGSQWPHVYIVNEGYAFRQHSHRWLYTALTRAETKVTVIL